MGFYGVCVCVCVCVCDACNCINWDEDTFPRALTVVNMHIIKLHECWLYTV